MNFAICISGGGGFAKVVYKNAHLLGDHKMALVICDRNSDGFRYFDKHTDIPTKLVLYDAYSSKDEAEKAILCLLASYNIDMVYLNYNRILGKTLIDAYQSRIINLHLSLLPLFPGFGAIEKAYHSHMLFHGSTVHLVDESVDGGPIIGQVVIPKQPGETIEQFTQRHFEQAAILFLDMIYKTLNVGIFWTDGRPYFKESEYGSSDFNPELSLLRDQIQLNVFD